MRQVGWWSETYKSTVDTTHIIRDHKRHPNQRGGMYRSAGDDCLVMVD